MAEPEKNPLEQIDLVSKTKAIFVWLAERIGRPGAVLVLALASVCLIWWQSDHKASRRRVGPRVD